MMWRADRPESLMRIRRFIARLIAVLCLTLLWGCSDSGLSDLPENLSYEPSNDQPAQPLSSTYEPNEFPESVEPLETNESVEPDEDNED